MIIRQLLLRNFMGYRRELGLDFRGRPTIGIVGNNESGKSTLLSAIAYLLYGDVPVLNQETREVNLISDTATSDLVVEGEVELPNGEVLDITRGRTRTNSPIVRLAGYGGKASEVGSIIAEKLRMGFSDFVALSYFVQGDIHQFMDGSKRDYFQRWASRLRQWERYERAAAEVASTIEFKRCDATQDLERAREAAGSLEEARRAHDQARADLAAADEQQRILEDQVTKLSDRVTKSAGDAAEVSGAKRELSQANALLAAGERRLRQAQSHLKELSDSKCPVLKVRCDRLIGGSQMADARLAAAREEQRAAEAEVAAAKQSVSDLERKCAQARPANGERDQAALREARAELASHASTRSRAAVAVGRAKERLDQAKAARERETSAQLALKLLEEEQRRVRFVQFMCGRSGIPLEVMDAELAAVEDKCNWVLERLDYPKRIRFAAYRELAGYEKVCPHCGGEAWIKDACTGCGGPRPHKRKDEPTVTVLEGGVERPFALESGGARVLQSFAVRLACSLFVASMTGARAQMVMLDEVFAMLDAGNRQKLMALIIGKLSSEFGLKQQFIVSHQEDVVNAVDDILVVQKRGGTSVARWA